MQVARNIRVQGQVQGVFFREWTVTVASSMGVTGWVRNRRDGSVEVMAVGEAELIDRFVDRLREGSPASRVDRVEVSSAPLEEYNGFARWATA